jgi:hypothetical protein
MKSRVARNRVIAAIGDRAIEPLSEPVRRAPRRFSRAVRTLRDGECVLAAPTHG